jgi:hypothetical protein
MKVVVTTRKGHVDVTLKLMYLQNLPEHRVSPYHTLTATIQKTCVPYS